MKDVFIMWIFAWAIAANTFNVVAALKDLVDRRQFVTATQCMLWNSPLEPRMPIRCFYFSWRWGMLVIALVAGVLIHWELNYYTTVFADTPSGYWETVLGMARDLLFIFTIGEVFIFYKPAIGRIRKELR